MSTHLPTRILFGGLLLFFLFGVRDSAIAASPEPSPPPADSMAEPEGGTRTPSTPETSPVLARILEALRRIPVDAESARPGREPERVPASLVAN